MAWTAYFDAIHQEMMGLMTEPSWATNTTITNRLTTIRNELLGIKTSLKGTDTELETLLTQLEAARVAAVDANEHRYDMLIGSEAEVMSYTEMADHMLTVHYATVTTGYGTLVTAQDVRDDAVVAKAVEIWTLLEEEFDELGDQAKADVADTYRSRRAELIQSMSDTGRYNTTISDSMTLNLAQMEANEVRRIEEQISGMRIQVRQAILSLELQTMQNASQNQLALGSEQLKAVMEIAGRMERLYQLAPSVVQAREDIAQSLMDIVNVTSMLVKGSAAKTAMPAMQSLMRLVQSEAQ